MILQHSEKMFRTYNNKTLSMVSKGFKTLDNFDEERIVKILFEETFFIDESRHIQVRFAYFTIITHLPRYIRSNNLTDVYKNAISLTVS